MGERKQPSILIVDDDDDDFELIREILKRRLGPESIHRAETGDEALNILRRRSSDPRAKDIDLVLLDLNLPGKTGYEVLRELKGDQSLKTIPVVVMTGSSNESDARTAYEMGANCYLFKPTKFDDLAKTISLLLEFWSDVATLPRKA